MVKLDSYAIKFVRWQHPAVGARDKIFDMLGTTCFVINLPSSAMQNPMSLIAIYIGALKIKDLEITNLNFHFHFISI